MPNKHGPVTVYRPDPVTGEPRPVEVIHKPRRSRGATLGARIAERIRDAGGRLDIPAELVGAPWDGCCLILGPRGGVRVSYDGEDTCPLPRWAYTAVARYLGVI